MQQDATRRWWRWTAVLGLAVMAITLAFDAIADLKACGPSDLRTVLAFEFARGPGDIATLLGEEPCRSRLIAAMTRHTWLDILAYIPAFTLFNMAGAMALRGRGPRLSATILALAVIAFVCDQSEDQILLRLVSDPPGTETMTNLLFAFVSTKFAALALACLAFAMLMWRSGGWLRIAAAANALGGAVALFALTDRAHYELVMGIGLGWVALLVVAGVLAFGKDRSPESGSH